MCDPFDTELFAAVLNDAKFDDGIQLFGEFKSVEDTSIIDSVALQDEPESETGSPGESQEEGYELDECHGKAEVETADEDTIIRAMMSTSSSDEPAKSTSFSQFVERFWTRHSVGGKSKMVVAKIKAKEIKLSVPSARNLDSNSTQISSMIDRAHNELRLLLFIMEKPHHDINLIKRQYISEVSWLTQVSTRSTRLSCHMEEKRYLTWLLYEIVDYQNRIWQIDKRGEVFDKTNAKQYVLKNEANQFQGPLFKPPIVRPFPQDYKPCRISFDVILKLRDLVFNSKDPTCRARFDVAGILEQREYTALMLDPYGYFNDIIRYVSPTVKELCDMLFMTDVSGTPIRAKCPCGMGLTQTSVGLQIHPEDCTFVDFARKFIPGIVRENFFVTHNVRVFSEKETTYLRSILKRRQPVVITKRDGNLIKTIERENGRVDKVISSTSVSENEKHRNQCAAKSACSSCSKRRN